MSGSRSPLTPGVGELLCDVASLGTAGEAATALPAVLRRLADEARAEACQLDSAVAGPAWVTLGNADYPRHVSRHLGGDFVGSWHGRMVLDRRCAMRIGPDDPYSFRRSWHFRDVLGPAGYADGVSLALRGNDQRVVGMLHLSASATRDFDDAVVAALPLLGRAVARVTTLLSDSGCHRSLPADFAAVQVVGDTAGERGAWPVPGRAPLPIPFEGELRALVLAVRASGAESATFLYPHDGGLLEVKVLVGTTATGVEQCLVAARPARDLLGLTPRQLEVLTAVATGAGNREIAAELCLTPRTVAAHLEAILSRLGAASRAGAAAQAVAHGVLLPRSDPASVRGLGRVLRRLPDAG